MKKRGEILYATAEHGAENQPERSGHVSELRGERRSDERPWPGDGREVVADKDPFIRGNEIFSIIEAFRRRCARVIKRQDFCGDERGVETIENGVCGGGSDDEPDGIQGLAPLKCDGCERTGAGE